MLDQLEDTALTKRLQMPHAPSDRLIKAQLIGSIAVFDRL
jgi:hypothetical protein